MDFWQIPGAKCPFLVVSTPTINIGSRTHQIPSTVGREAEAFDINNNLRQLADLSTSTPDRLGDPILAFFCLSFSDITFYAHRIIASLFYFSLRAPSQYPALDAPFDPTTLDGSDFVVFPGCYPRNVCCPGSDVSVCFCFHWNYYIKACKFTFHISSNPCDSVAPLILLLVWEKRAYTRWFRSHSLIVMCKLRTNTRLLFGREKIASYATKLNAHPPPTDYYFGPLRR